MDPVASSVGAWLRAAREAAGLSEDAVAQQLKLHPRQVRAIEEDDFARLPGRTFVRGFVRNYARLVNLDSDAVVAALPTGESTSPLERLTYTPSSRPMGEIPLEAPRRSGGTARWLIPLVLLAAVAVAAYFEFARTPTPRPATPDGIMPPPAPKALPPSGPAVTPLPNPLDAPKSEVAAPAVAAAEAPAPAAAAPASAAPAPATMQPQSAATPTATTSATSAASSAASPATSAVPPPASPIAGAVPAPSAAPVVAAAAPAPTQARTEPAGDSTLVLTFTGTSWVRVKDESGAVLVSQTGTAGATLPVGGRPPLDVVIGNADKVRALFRGQPVDLAPHTRFNVARLVLQ